MFYNVTADGKHYNVRKVTYIYDNLNTCIVILYKVSYYRICIISCVGRVSKLFVAFVIVVSVNRKQC